MELLYKNNLGNEITLSTNPSTLRLYEVAGLDGLSNNLYSTKNVNQDGITIDNMDLQERSITLKGKIITTDKEEIQRNKNKLLSIFNPKFGGIIKYKDLYINCEVEAGPVFSYKSYNILEWIIELVAPKPYLESVQYGEEISTWINGLCFKFSLPFKLKERGETKKNVTNEGHADTPIQIYFKGPAVNPKIVNHSTGEYIQVIKELTTDDILIINTEFGNKTVEIERDNIRTNAFQYIDLDSVFFNLKVGDNLIEYSSENEINPQSVEIRYKNRYVGI